MYDTCSCTRTCVCAHIHTYIYTCTCVLYTHTHTHAYYTLRHIINDKKFGTNKVLRTHKEIRSVWLLEVWRIVSKISANIRFKLGEIGELAKLKSLKLLSYTVHIQCVHTHTHTHTILWSHCTLGVQSAAVSVICELARKNPRNYLSLAPIFFKLLTSSSNNWMLIKIIKLVSSCMCNMQVDIEIFHSISYNYSMVTVYLSKLQIFHVKM